MDLIRYADWSMRPRGATPADHPIGATKGITAHWEGPHMGAFPHGHCAAKVRGIQRFHRDTRGWADIAYNAVVCPHGYVFEGRGPNVRSAANGGTQQNADYYAVCYLGGEDDPFTDEGRQGFLDAFGWLTREGGAGPERNGHRDVRPEPTACPGPDIYRWVHSLAPGTTAAPEEDDMPDETTLRRMIREESELGVTDALNANRWPAYGEDGTKRRMSHILLRTDLGVRRLLAQDLPTAADIAAEIAKRGGGSIDQATVEAGVTAVLARLTDDGQ